MFKQLSNRVSAKTIEETYTDNDVEHVKNDVGQETTDISLNYQPNTGFTFDYPQRWLNEETDFKAIGIRRLKVIPTSHVFALECSVKWKVEEDKIYTKSFTIRETITPDNSFEEIMCDIITKLNQCLSETPAYEGASWGANEFMSFVYTFDYKTGDFSLKLVFNNEDDYYEIYGFSIYGEKEYIANDEDIELFLKFLNQERTEENKNILHDQSLTKSFTNVWDRRSLQFHASFSNNRRNFIGLNNDFYDSPSVFYDPPTNQSDFWIKFTTDGTHQFLPRYCRFYIGLSFVRNYKNSLVTK